MSLYGTPEPQNFRSMSGRASARGWWVLLAIVGVVFVFATGLVLVLYTAAPSDGIGRFGRARIAILPLRGVITDGHALIEQLRDYRRDRSVRGFVVHVDSPGGEVAPSQSIYRALRRASEDGVPVVVAIGSLGASGAYYAALGGDTIIAMPGSLVGSIGVVMEFPNARELLEKVGLRYEVVKSGEHKDLGSPFRDATPEDLALLQGVVDDVYNQFVDAIAEERGLTRDSVLKVADGRLLSGRQAAEYGLIDREGDLSDAIAMAGTMAGLGSDPRTVTPQVRRARWVDLLGSMAAWAAQRSGGLIGLNEPRRLLEEWINAGPRLFYMHTR